MGLVPHSIKFVDDVLFVTLDVPDSTDWNNAFRCIHIPSLVVSTQLPGGSLSLTKSAFAALFLKYIMESPAVGSLFPVYTKIYSIPSCPPTHPRYCFIIRRFRPVGRSLGVEWEVLEAEIDLRIPGPIKIFSKVSRQDTLQCPTYPFVDIDQ